MSVPAAHECGGHCPLPYDVTGEDPYSNGRLPCCRTPSSDRTGEEGRLSVRGTSSATLQRWKFQQPHTHTCSCVPLADWWQCVRAPLRCSAGLRLRNRDQNGSPLQLQLSNYLILISLLHLGLGCLFVDPLLDLHIDRRDLLALEQLPGARTGLSPRHHVGLFWAAPLAGG